MAAAASVTAEQVRMATPDDPIEEGDTVIGVLDTGLQRLLALAHDYAVQCKTVEEAAEAANKAGNNEVLDGHLRQMRMLESEIETIYQNFWTSVKSAFGLWSAPGIAIRKDWQVVIIEERPQPQFRILSIGLGALDLGDLVEATRRGSRR